MCDPTDLTHVRIDYMSPEMIVSAGHDISVDHWALGVLLYEMLCGATPFRRLADQDIRDTGGGADTWQDGEVTTLDIFANITRSVSAQACGICMLGWTAVIMLWVVVCRSGWSGSTLSLGPWTCTSP